MKSIAMDARRMRLHNSEQVLRIVREHGPVSRTEIARHCRLSAPTVAAAVSSLVRTGIVEERGEGKSTGGRRPQLVSFNSRFGAVVAGYFGATAIRLALADASGREIAKRVLPSGDDIRPEPLLARVAAAVRDFVVDELGPDVPLLATVIGAPGMTDMDRGVVLEAANLDGWTQVPAREVLERALGGLVVVDNDVNLAAIGEHWKGGREAQGSFVFVTLATGIGAAIVIDGKVHRGYRWTAGEISHVNVDYREWDVDFGAAGYLESYLAGSPSGRAARRGLGAVDDDGVLRLGAAIANIATILDPESIVVGGRVAAANPELLARVSKVARRIAPNCPELGLTVLGDDAPLFGGLKLAFDHVDELLPQYLVEP
jgi:glucokinase